MEELLIIFAIRILLSLGAGGAIMGAVWASNPCNHYWQKKRPVLELVFFIIAVVLFIGAFTGKDLIDLLVSIL